MVTTDQYEKDGKTYLAEINKEAFEDFGFPSLQMDIVKPPDPAGPIDPIEPIIDLEIPKSD